MSHAGRLWVVLLLLPVAAAVLLAVTGTPWVPHPPGAVVGPPYSPPGPGLPLGTDRLGRDVVSGVLTGARGTVLMPLAAAVVGTAVALLGGLWAGYRGGAHAAVLLRGADLLLALPPLLVLLVVTGAGAPGPVVLAVVCLLTVPVSIRYLAAATATVAGAGYVEHAVALGERPAAVLLREVLPALTGPVLSDAALRLVGCVYLFASLSYLGVDAPDDVAGGGWASQVAAASDAAGLNAAALVAPAAALAAFAVPLGLLATALAARRGES